MLKISMKIFWACVASAFTFICSSNATGQTQPCKNLSQVLNLKTLSGFSEQSRGQFEASAVWSEDKALTAFCDDDSCYIVKACEHLPKVIDVSGVIKANLGYFGINPKYQKIENMPLIITENESKATTVWRNRIHAKTTDNTPPTFDETPSTFGAVIRTRIWNDGQRYTTSDILLIQNDVYQGR